MTPPNPSPESLAKAMIIYDGMYACIPSNFHDASAEEAREHDLDLIATAIDEASAKARVPTEEWARNAMAGFTEEECKGALAMYLLIKHRTGAR